MRIFTPKSLTMKFRTIIFFVSLLLCETTSLFSFNDTPHNNNYLYRYYNNLEENINYIYSITQDSDGLIWMSAQEGIFRFDGNRLRKIDELFGNEYKDKIIRCSLNADIYGNVWFYKNNLLSSINVKTGKISTHLDSLLNTTPKKFIKSVIIKDSNMFLGTNSGIYSYNILSHKYSSILKTNNIALLSEIYKNNIWIIKRDNTTIKYDIITGNFLYYYPNIGSLGTSTCIKQINDSTLLVGKHDNGGLWLYDLKSNNTKNLISGTTITCIESFFDGNYSMATKNGIYIFNPSNNNISLINKNHISFMSIPENFISTLKKDKEGGIWIGSYYQGFCYLPEQPIELKFYIPGTTNKDFKGNIVMQLREDSQNNMWVITQDNGVNKFNKKTNSFTNFSKNHIDAKLESSNFFSSIIINNELWLGSIDSGIEVIDINTGKSLKKFEKSNKPGSLNNNTILTFHYTTDKELYIGTGSGLILYDRVNDRFIPIHSNDIGGVNSICKDSSDLWVGTWEGLYRITKDDKIIKYNYNEADTNSIPDNTISYILRSKDKKIYIGTFNGFCIYNPKTNKFHRHIFNKYNKIAINGIVEDNNNFIWGTSDNGIFKYNPKDDSIIQYNNLDGPFKHKLNQMPYITKDGNIYFGTHNGFVSFNTNKIFSIENTYKPQIKITGFLIKENSRIKDSIIIGNTNNLKLKHNQNFISIYYSFPSYIFNNNYKCSYKLEGADENWTTTIGYKPIEFQNLESGSYKLHIKVSDFTNIYFPDEIIFSFTIMPPFWLSIWAYIIYAVVLLTLGYFLYAFFKAKERKRNNSIIKDLAEKKEKEMYNNRIHFFLTIAHEIRTPLTLIKLSIEHLFELLNNNEKYKEDISIIEKNVNRLTELGVQILNSNNSTNIADVEIKYSKTNISTLINEIIFMFGAAIKDKHITIKKDIPNKFIHAFIDKEIFTKIITNLISNAIKYCDKLIEIQLYVQENEIVFNISNDGSLINESDKENVFKLFYRNPNNNNIVGNGVGLAVAKQLAIRHGGDLEILFDKEHLNHFMLVIPLDQDVYIEEKVDEISKFNEQVEILNINTQETKKSLLIIEDDSDLRHYIANYFKNEYKIFTSSNCSNGVDLLKKNNISLVISDVITPGGMDGLQLCKIIKSSIDMSHIPIILISANDTFEAKLTSFEYGADAYLEKPFSIKQLDTRVKSLIKYREKIYEDINKKPVNPFDLIEKNKMEKDFYNNFYNLIEEHINDPNLNMVYISKKLNMSQSSVYKRIKDLSGTSPNDLIRIIRLKKAATLILKGGLSLKEVAYQTGYTSQAYFTNCFVRQFGMSPSEYQKKHSK